MLATFSLSISPLDDGIETREGQIGSLGRTSRFVTTHPRHRPGTSIAIDDVRANVKSGAEGGVMAG